MAIAFEIPTRKRTEPLGVLSARSRFDRYKPEDQNLVRVPQVSGDELDHLRAKRDLLKSMSPEQAFSVIEIHYNITLAKALELAKTEHNIIVPNSVIDRILTETKELTGMQNILTGTIVAYEASGKALREKICHRRNVDRTRHSFSFDIPVQFRGKHGALVIEHPDFDLVELGNDHEFRIVDQAGILLENFAEAKIASLKNWHHYDEEFRLPIDSAGIEETGKRQLHRYRISHVGPIVRMTDDFISFRRLISADVCPVHEFPAVALF